VREIRSPGSVRGAARKGRPYRDPPVCFCGVPDLADEGSDPFFSSAGYEVAGTQPTFASSGAGVAHSLPNGATTGRCRRPFVAATRAVRVADVPSSSPAERRVSRTKYGGLTGVGRTLNALTWVVSSPHRSHGSASRSQEVEIERRIRKISTFVPNGYRVEQSSTLL